MSYASKLVAMSRGDVPSTPARVIGDHDGAPREKVVETDVRVPKAAPQVAEAARSVRAPVPPPVVPVPSTPRAAAAVEAPAITTRRESPPAPAPAPHETIERHTILEPAPPAPPRANPQPLPLPAREPTVLPPQAQWLTEETAAPDPLVASADTDALRELMRSVRQWTASAPTVIEHPDAPATVASPAAVAAPPAPTQVSIGNVTITVEDAPAATTKRAAAPARSTSDRLARNHIRGT